MNQLLSFHMNVTRTIKRLLSTSEQLLNRDRTPGKRYSLVTPKADVNRLLTSPLSPSLSPCCKSHYDTAPLSILTLQDRRAGREMGATAATKGANVISA